MDQSDLFLGAKYLSNISSDASPFPTDIESPKSKFERDGVASSNKVYDTQIWTRHLLLYGILGNIGMLFTVISPSTGGVLSAMFCVGTYGHVFMEGSILLRLISTSNRYKIQQLHGIWGLVTLFNLLFFSESFGQLSWAAESILTDSMSLMAGFYLMQSDVDKQVKYIALSHFIHGITFELFLWCDIAGMNANITTERGVWWVILVVANASCQILFHCPVIRGKVEINPQKPQTPTASEVRFLVFLWVLHGIFTIPTVLSLSTAAGNNFYLSKWVSEFYLKMIYLVPMVTLMYTLACFVDNDKNAHATSIWSELGFQEPERFAPRAASGRGYMEDNAKTHKGYNRAPSAGSTHTDALPSAHTMEKNEVRKFFFAVSSISDVARDFILVADHVGHDRISGRSKCRAIFITAERAAYATGGLHVGCRAARFPAWRWCRHANVVAAHWQFVVHDSDQPVSAAAMHRRPAPVAAHTRVETD